MKLLTQYETDSEADSVSARLEDKGIATYVSSRNALGFPGWSTGPAMVGLWVLIDEQYEDAMALLYDPEHTVSNPLSMPDILAAHASVRSGDLSAALTALGWMSAVLLLFVAVVFLITGLK